MQIAQCRAQLAARRVSQGASEAADLFRGMRDMQLPPSFVANGGAELACMSTTTDLSVAIRYSASQASLLLARALLAAGPVLF